MIRVCVAGITGWTGRPLARAIADADDLDLVSGVSRSSAGTTSRVSPCPCSVRWGGVGDRRGRRRRRLHRCRRREGERHGRARACRLRRRRLERPTAADYDELDRRAREVGVGVIAAGNFSLLAALLARSAADIARHVRSWEILDYASASKPDVPSGTSRELAERLAESGEPALEHPLGTLHGPVEARGATVAGTQIHSVRLLELRRLDGDRLRRARRTPRPPPRPGREPEPYIAGTLLAIRSVQGRVGLTRGLDALID